MPTEVPFEIERIRRILQTFGWTITATEETGTNVIVTVQLAKEV